MLGLPCGVWASLVVALSLSCPAACGILVSQPDIEPALESRFLTLNHQGSPLVSFDESSSLSIRRRRLGMRALSYMQTRISKQ